MSTHTVKSYTHELEALTADVSRMGGMTEKQVADVIDALERRDGDAAQQVISDDLQLDAYERQVEDAALRMIALRQPLAVDLRCVMAATKMCGELERTGDLAKNTAKRAKILFQEPPLSALSEWAGLLCPAFPTCWTRMRSEARTRPWLSGGPMMRSTSFTTACFGKS